MSVLCAERSFNNGLAALAESRHAEAAEHFRSAMEAEKQRDVNRPDMRYLSYYGLSVARATGPSSEALRACEIAVNQEPLRPTFLLNLGRVCLMAGQKTRALECFQRGVGLAPNHGPLLRELTRLDRRARPLVRAIGRSHPINRWAGRVRRECKTRSPRWVRLSPRRLTG